MKIAIASDASGFRLKEHVKQVLREAEEQYRRGNLLACIATVQGVTVTYDPNGILEENIT